MSSLSLGSSTASRCLGSKRQGDPSLSEFYAIGYASAFPIGDVPPKRRQDARQKTHPTKLPHASEYAGPGGGGAGKAQRNANINSSGSLLSKHSIVPSNVRIFF
ncbi:hypothetical protein DQ04_18741020, partial [Trypanosoma grayi]|uniref:hypothetical protein n=1 Tax=Trypanosoma grayi TaxID=71804 RepID=UPI0004F4631D